MPEDFDFRDWLNREHENDPKRYPWDKAAKFLVGEYHECGLRPFAAFSGGWEIGDYERPKEQGRGYIVLLEAEFWLVQSRLFSDADVLKFDAQKVASVSGLDPRQDWNWRHSNLRLNREWMRLHIYPLLSGGAEAALEFRRYT